MRNKKKAASEYIETVTSILQDARDELTRADNKAALFLAAAGVIVGALLAALIAGDWAPGQLLGCVQWVWWTGALAGLVGLSAFAYAVYPRTNYRERRPPDLVAYFGDVVVTPPDKLRERLITTAETQDSRLLDQLKAISSIVDRKYRGIQTGLWLFGTSGVMCTAAVVVNLFLS